LSSRPLTPPLKRFRKWRFPSLHLNSFIVIREKGVAGLSKAGVGYSDLKNLAIGYPPVAFSCAGEFIGSAMVEPKFL